MPAGLSNLQKRDIAIAARAAYQAWDGREAFEAINSDQSRTACFEGWRHVEIGNATGGIQSLRECTQAHYATVLAHFQRLAGRAEAAQRTLVRDQDNGRRIAMHKLTAALRERGLVLDYAATICRSKFKCPLDRASESQVWKLFYDVKRARKPVAAYQPPTNGDPF